MSFQPDIHEQVWVIEKELMSAFETKKDIGLGKEKDLRK